MILDLKSGSYYWKVWGFLYGNYLEKSRDLFKQYLTEICWGELGLSQNSNLNWKRWRTMQHQWSILFLNLWHAGNIKFAIAFC